MMVVQVVDPLVITFYTHNLSRRFTATLKSKAAVLMNSEMMMFRFVC